MIAPGGHAPRVKRQPEIRLRKGSSLQCQNGIGWGSVEISIEFDHLVRRWLNELLPFGTQWSSSAMRHFPPVF
jgi:hypothetical protein